MKRALLSLGSFGCIIVLAAGLFSCGGGQGNGLVLWAPQDGALKNGALVRVVRKSETTSVVRSPAVKGTVELESWRLREAGSREKAAAEASAYAPYLSTFAYALRDGLPLREEPDQESRRVYKLREGQVVKVLARGESKVQIASYEDYWYRVLTDDGSEGWCFGYFLPVFQSAGDPLTEAAALKAQDPLLDALTSTQWRPEYFQEMADSGRIDLERFTPEVGFFVDAERKVAQLVLPGFRQSWDFRSIENVGPSRYVLAVLAGPELRVTLSGPDRLVLTYPRKEQQLAQVFIDFPEDLDEVIQKEQGRRQALFQDFARRGPAMTSSAYGRIVLGEPMRFSWEGFGRLGDQVFLRAVRGEGTVDFPFKPGQDLAARFDGVITFRFSEYGPGQSTSFLYKFDGAGVRFVFLRQQYVEDSEAVRLDASPLVVYFNFGKP
jgi:hypothetical protein